MMQTLVIHPYLKRTQRAADYSLSYKLEEARRLALSLHVNVVEALPVALSSITPATYIGKGKIAELKERIIEQEIGLVIINDIITPVQQRNLEKAFEAKVIDRTALILEIFAERAKTKEGILQVELALQEYQKSRLIRSWTHLERQRGGAGFMGGPGETQIESDRRGISDRILQIKRQLEKVANRRELHRSARRKVPYAIVALVGYTNAGKSTLFNYLTHANVVAEDKLFATLDPTMRLVKLPSGRKVIFSDTVGFISHLPTELVAAFRATLEEVVEADALLHVRDITHSHTEEQKEDVLKILTGLVGEERVTNDTVEVMNKIDLLEAVASDDLGHLPKTGVAVSALTGQGIPDLLAAIEKKLSVHEIIRHLKIPLQDGELLAWLYRHAGILSREDRDDTSYVTCTMSDKDWGGYQKMTKGRVK
jgi:GTPase